MPDVPTLLRRGRSLVLALLAAALALPALAQNDPPDRVGRVAWTTGDVYLSNAASGELGAAPLNQPLTGGDVLSTGPDGRAEIQIGAMTLRLDANSRITLNRLDDAQVHVVLDGGRVIAKLPTEDTRHDFVLDAAGARFQARGTGIYRFDRDGAESVATSYFGVLRGEIQDAAFDINAGESARIGRDGSGRPAYRMVPGLRDEFTQWSAARDQQQRSVASARYVSPEMTGVQDLDAWGDWSETPDYGAVWFPRAVTTDWAPYRDGRWVWVAPWGWTWIGAEPWGFAPFHYGRWARVRGAWAWVPGTRLPRPAYAPALVAWTDPSGSLGVHIGRAAPPPRWFPLAPREVYVPFFRASPAYVRHVNGPHAPQLHDVDEIVARPYDAVRRHRYTFRDEPRAMTSGPAASPGPFRPTQRPPMAAPEPRAPGAPGAPAAPRVPRTADERSRSPQPQFQEQRQAQPRPEARPERPPENRGNAPAPNTPAGGERGARADRQSAAPPAQAQQPARPPIQTPAAPRQEMRIAPTPRERERQPEARRPEVRQEREQRRPEAAVRQERSPERRDEPRKERPNRPEARQN